MNHPYTALLSHGLPRPLVALGLLLTAGTAHAQTPAPTFAAVATYSTGGGSGPTDLVVADVNGDGNLDLLTANLSNDRVGVLLGTGTGTFGPVTQFSTGGSSGPLALVVADVNGDGNLDLLTASNGSNTAGVLLGTGTGSFGPVTQFSTGGSRPSDLAVADVNGDGQLDLLTANTSSGTAGVLLGTGTGTFGAVTTYSTGSTSSPIGIAVADVNGDGKLDLLTANQGNTAGVLLGTGTGAFGAVTTYSTGNNSFPSALAVADVNGDGRLDLLTANAGAGAGTSTVGVLLGTGSGRFGAVVPYSIGSGSGPFGLAVADVNGDGKLDVLTANANSNTVGVLLGTGTGSFGTATTFSTGNNSYPTSIRVADVNGDGKPDLLTANAYGNSAGVLLNTTVYAPTLTLFSPTTGSVGTSVTLTGTSLSGATAISFNGTPASSFVVTSPTTITAVVAAGTTTGPVRVTTPGGTATSATSFVVRVAPTTVADAYSTPQNVPLTGNVLRNDGGTNPVAILIIHPTHGTLLLNPDGSFSYQPAAGYTGPDSFLYYACDPSLPLLCGNPATVTINVVRVAPITVADAYSTPQGVTLRGNVLSNDIGTNPQAILIIRPTHGTFLLNPDGTFTYQPAAGYVGPDSFLYYACNMGAPLVCGDPATVSLTVTPAVPSLTAAKLATTSNARGTTNADGAAAAQELALTGSPNPFANELRLRFALPTAQAYTLAVYDAQGRLVQQLASGQAEAGQAQELGVSTYTYATGLYLLRLTTATGSQLLKLIKQ
jgi:hypothetical protein